MLPTLCLELGDFDFWEEKKLRKNFIYNSDFRNIFPLLTRGYVVKCKKSTSYKCAKIIHGVRGIFPLFPPLQKICPRRGVRGIEKPPRYHNEAVLNKTT